MRPEQGKGHEPNQLQILGTHSHTLPARALQSALRVHAAPDTTSRLGRHLQQEALVQEFRDGVCGSTWLHSPAEQFVAPHAPPRRRRARPRAVRTVMYLLA